MHEASTYVALHCNQVSMQTICSLSRLQPIVLYVYIYIAPLTGLLPASWERRCTVHLCLLLSEAPSTGTSFASASYSRSVPL